MTPPAPQGSLGEHGAARPAVITVGVIENRRASSVMWRLVLAVPDGWGPPLPGQFVSLALERAWDDEQPGDVSLALLRRPFSVADFSVPGGRPRLEILYAPVGKVTRRLRVTPAGAALDLLGPLGTVFPLDVPDRPVLVAGGRGIAPFVFYARERARRGLPFTLLYGVRAGEELMALPDLPADSIQIATEDGAQGRAGTAADLLEAQDPRERGAVLSCGPLGLLRAVARWAKRNDRPCWVSVEEVFACGMGLCGGCAVPSSDGGFRWACRDGPVMEAESVDWERCET